MKPGNRAFPYILAFELYLILCAISILYLLSRTHGQFVYPLDDIYITMAIAKNTALHGVMGLTRHAFTFSSSCPSWMALIAALDWVTGAAWWVPLLLSLLAGAAALFAAGRVLESFGLGGKPSAIGLLAVCAATPLVAMALSGMEHALHIALALLFVPGACRFLENGSTFPKRDFLRLLGLLVTMVTVRYETLFLAGIFSLLLCARRRWLSALLPVPAALAPVALLGAISVSHGWQWLPNSLLLKGSAPDLSSLGGLLDALGMRSLRMLFGTPHLLALVAMLLAVSIWRALRGNGFWTRGQLLIFFSVAGILLHLQFAGVGWFYRYEAYLVALGVTALFANRADLLARELLRMPQFPRAAAVLAALLAIFPLGFRAIESIGGFPVSAYNIYEQQYQMALFLRTYYQGASIAANDVGAINYVADLRCLDLVGLCDREIFRLKRRHAYDTAAMQAQAAAANVRIALVYDTWFDGVNRLYGPQIPSSWTRVGRWRIPDNVFNGGDTVSFYAVEPGEIAYLAGSLRAFAPRLPDTVERQ